MKKIILITTLTLGLFAQSSLEIAKKSYGVISNYGASISKTTMILKNAKGIENVRRMEIKKLENNEGDKSLLVFLYPNDIKGTKLRSFEQIGRDDKQWLYLPALKRIKRISSRNKSGSFMASEFSYEDIASQNYKNYTYSENVKTVMMNNTEHFKITRFPKDKNSGYSKQIIYINTITYLAHFGEYYDRKKRLLKEVSFLKYKKIDGVQRIQKMVMKNIQNRKMSTLIWDEDKIKLNLSRNIFSKRALK